MTTSSHVMILGVGNILLTDEGFGVRVVEHLERVYEFPENVSVVDGGVLGIHLMGTIAAADYLIVVDAVRNGKPPGAFHRLAGEAIPKRILAKNSLHQVDLLEALTLCQALDKVPETVILGIEPADIETYSVDLTPTVGAQVEPMAHRVLEELERLGIGYRKKVS